MFEALFDQFKRAGLLSEFGKEIRPYLLSGTFCECILPEKVLSASIINHFSADKSIDDNYG